MIRDGYCSAILAAMWSVLSWSLIKFTLRVGGAWRVAAGLLLLSCTALAGGQQENVGAQVTVAVVDENGHAVEGAQVTIAKPGMAPVDDGRNAGTCTYELRGPEPYELSVDKAGFYKTNKTEVDASLPTVRVALAHEQIVREQVNVTASTPAEYGSGKYFYC